MENQDKKKHRILDILILVLVFIGLILIFAHVFANLEAACADSATNPTGIDIRYGLCYCLM